MQADAFLFDELATPGAAGDHRAAHLRPHAARAAQPRRRRAPGDAGGGRDRRRGGRGLLEGGLRPTLAHVIPNFQNPAGLHAVAGQAAAAAGAGPRARLRDLRGRPVRRHPVQRRAAAADAGARRRRGQRARGLRVLVLQDRLPRHPGRLPGRPAGADQEDPGAGHQHLHRAEHGRPGHRLRLPAGRAVPGGAGAGEGGAGRAGRAAGRRAARAPAAGDLPPSRGRVLPVGVAARGRGPRRRPDHRRGRRPRGGDRAGHRLPAGGRRATPSGSPTPRCSPATSTRACAGSPRRSRPPARRRPVSDVRALLTWR